MKYRIIIALIVFVAASAGYVAYHYFALCRLAVWEERVYQTKVDTFGMAWSILCNEEDKKNHEVLFCRPLPPNDFTKNFLLVSQGRRIKEITYYRYSQFQWDRGIIIGTAAFEGPIYPHTLFVYKTDRELVMREND